jgi:hypothetical protein
VTPLNVYEVSVNDAANGKRFALLLPFHAADPYSVAIAAAMSVSMRCAITPSNAGMMSFTVMVATWSLETAFVALSTTLDTNVASAGYVAFSHSR